MSRFHVFRHKRQGEFLWAIGEGDKVLATIGRYQDAKSIVDVMNANELDSLKVADLETVTRGESIRREHLQDVMTARRYSAV